MSNATPHGPTPDLVLVPTSGWRALNLAELYRYRDLFRFLVWRSVKAKYAQTILGFGWAILRPLFSMVIFTVIFGKLARIPSDGIPYPIFSFCALVPWTYFSTALNSSSISLVGSQNLINKVYFPRLVIPLTPVLAGLVDFAIAMGMLAILMIPFKIIPTAGYGIRLQLNQDTVVRADVGLSRVEGLDPMFYVELRNAF